MPKEFNGFSNRLICNFDRVLSHWIPMANEEEFPCTCGQEDGAVKEAWEGRSPAERICDLAQGITRGCF